VQIALGQKQGCIAPLTGRLDDGFEFERLIDFVDRGALYAAGASFRFLYSISDFANAIEWCHICNQSMWTRRKNSSKEGP
jgi:hypothetical protein